MAGTTTTNPDISVIVITTGRQGLYPLLRALERQEAGFAYETVIIANGPVDEGRLESAGVRLFREPAGKGIPYYRNRGTEEARGSVIVYIDDDEVPPGDCWLSDLVEPILTGGESVTVAGARIPPGQGFLADLISMLGYPGGGSLGWRNVWEVDECGYTDKLCTCNCAIEKDLLVDVGGFHEDLAYGTSDLFLGETLLEKGARIRFVDDNAVFHEPRRDLRSFISWQVNRGRSIHELKSVRPLGQFQRKHVAGRFKRTWVILKKTFPSSRFVPMLGILSLEFSCHLVGYALEYIQENYMKGKRGCGPRLERGIEP
jgi:GT2 family glycosyltransferase